ncbi:MAG: cupin domain-containing protein [Thermomicrobiales bacterium]|nr:cupin domain-containing protein [Thermomicrobiales bacterium]
MTVDDVIAHMRLVPLPGEGGFYRQTWVEEGKNRPIGTAIMYLVTPESFSALHRLDADEVFHFYLGDPCEQIVISPSGELTTRILGQDIAAGQHVQAIVPKDHWQGTALVEGGEWALLGTTMAPGYQQSGFDLAAVDDIADLEASVAMIASRYLADGA